MQNRKLTRWQRDGIISLFICLSLLLMMHLTAQAQAGALPQDEIRIELPRAAVSTLLDEETGTVHFAGADIQYLSQSGEPALPAQVIKVLLPPDADLATVSALVENEQLEPVPGAWDVAPVPPLAPSCTDVPITPIWPQGKTIVAGRDVAVYGRAALFPASSLGRLSSGNLRKWVLVDIPVALYRYNPVSKQLFRLAGGELVVRFSRRPELLMTANPAALAADRIGEETVRRLAVNFAKMAPVYETVAAAAATQSEPSRYVIITTEAIQSASQQLANFVSSKEARGLIVQVVTEGTWGGGTGDVAAEHIRQWLQATYLDLGIEYVLLIGNPNPATGDVPMKMLWPGWSVPVDNSPSDYYYTDLTGNWDADGDGRYGEVDDLSVDGIDRNWEVVVGRIPYYGNVADLDHILAKLIAYENASAGEALWRQNVLLPMTPSDPSTPGYHLGEAIKDTIITTKGGWGYHRIYRETYGLIPPPETTPINADLVTNVWNAAPFGAIFWWTHGWSQGAVDTMDNAHAATLNDNYPGFTFQASCNNAEPEVTENLAYMLLKNGAIGTVGATRVSWYFVGETEFVNTPSNAGLAYQYAKRLIGPELDSGHALQELKLSLDPGIWMNWTDFNLYGDPAQGIFTAKSIVVNSVADPGDGVCEEAECTLREAIDLANATPGLDVIHFNIPGDGPFVIQPTTPLPTITDAVVINGYSQPNAGPNTQWNPLKDGSSFTILIELDGSLLPRDYAGNGLDITAASGAVRGLMITNFPDAGIRLAAPEPGEGFTIAGNLIGTDGNASRANSVGVLLLSANNTVGGTTPDAYNVISGNEYEGIRIVAPNNRVLGNLIGVDMDGIRPLNNGSGIDISGASHNIIGAESHPFGNIIGFNRTVGIAIRGNAVGNQLQRNVLFDNNGPGIDLGGDGVTLNDPLDSDTGPNLLQNYPVLTAAERGESTLLLRGTLNSTPNMTFQLAFFSSPACDPSGFGEGKEFLGSTSVTTNAQGEASFAATFAPPEEGPFVTATAMDPAGNTSEFAQCIEMTQAPPGVLYLSSSSGGKVAGIQFANEDILAYHLDTGAWSLFFDGSDVGLKNTDVDAFALTADGALLLSTGDQIRLPDVGWVDDSDIVRFVPTALGATTRGRYESYFDGSAVDLTKANEDVDAFALAPDGRLIFSTLGSFSVPGVSGEDKDLLAFQVEQLGPDTRGQWTLYFDGSDVGLTKGDEDIWGVWLKPVSDQPYPQLYLTTKGKFTVEGLQGTGADLFIFTSGALGDTTQGAFTSFWRGAEHGFAGEQVDGFTIGQTLPLTFSMGVDAADLNEVPEVADDTSGDDVADDDMSEDQYFDIFLPMIAR